MGITNGSAIRRMRQVTDGRKTQTYIVKANGQQVGSIYGRFKTELEAINTFLERRAALGYALPEGQLSLDLYPVNVLDNYGVKRGG